ncbi:GntR family transcriptional regulator (fragment) [Cupriavidus taiwanensis]|uniref:GntR family transcriptional regulator n=1 Tax=Cupriavidus taiwanensis TaxID=164546 RepID=A0A375EI13_9BURK
MSKCSSAAIDIISFIQNENLAVGAHLPAQRLADKLRVYRSPLNEALLRLHERGIVTRKENHGYFVAKVMDVPASEVASQLLKDRHELTATQLNAVLQRISQEGRGMPSPGYGWEFMP